MRDKRKIFNFILAIVLITAICAGVLLGVSKVVERKDARRYDELIEKGEDCDVLFFGSSHMINGVFPNYLWKNYGITAFNCAAHADYLPSTYWVLRNSLDYSSPKLVVIDCYTISDMFKVCSYDFLHGWMDDFPLTITKLEAIRDLTDDEFRDECIASGELDPSVKGTTGELIWDFSKYHYRWDEITDEDFDTPSNKERGAESRINVMPMEDTAKISPDRIYDGDGVGVKYLERMIEECQAQGIEVLLTYIPYSASEERQEQANLAGQIAEKYGVNYINFLNIPLVDYSVDYYDETHLNTSGAGKITDYIGQYIEEHYDIEDHRGDPHYDYIDEEYYEYTYYKRELFERQDNVQNALLLLKDSDFDSCIEVDNAAFWNNETIRNLLNNINDEAGSLPLDTGYIIIESGGEKMYYSKEMPEKFSACFTDDSEADDSTFLVSASADVRIVMLDKERMDASMKEFSLDAD